MSGTLEKKNCFIDYTNYQQTRTFCLDEIYIKKKIKMKLDIVEKTVNRNSNDK